MDYFRFDGRWPVYVPDFKAGKENCSLLYQHFRTYGFKRRPSESGRLPPCADTSAAYPYN
jgi:hypothetical protein